MKSTEIRSHRHHDLGTLEGPVLLFGGPYSNAHALKALQQVAEERGIEAASCICTGDAVAYAGQPVETVACLRTWGAPVVAGNCEAQLGAGAADCGCGFEDGSACDLLSINWFSFASQHLAQKDKDWMRTLPDVITFTHNAHRYGVIHGGVKDVARFVWSTSEETVLAEEWAALQQIVGPVNHIVAGHCGIPFVRDTPRGRWINAGVIGMPPHDGRVQTRYAVLDRGNIEICDLGYDAKGAATAMASAGLPPDYARSLLSGYWPSEDILPEALRVPLSARG